MKYTYTVDRHEDLKYVLRSAMAVRGITQKQLATLSNASLYSISAILNGRKMPTIAFLRRIAEELDVEFEIKIDGGNFYATQGSGRESAGSVPELRHAAHADE